MDDNVDSAETARKNREALVSYLGRGQLRCGHGSIGLELEHQIARKGSHAPVSFSGPGGIEDILEALSEGYPERTLSHGHLIGLARADSTITLEPAGQLEISIAPQCSLAGIEAIYAEFRTRLDDVLERFDAEALETGYHPTARARELELIPKDRYRLMDAHFARTGSKGVCMMRGSASTQVSIDYAGEDDAIRKFRVASALGPLLAFVCDNTPVFEGSPSDGRMARTLIWDDVDAERSMVAPGVFEEGYSFHSYADHLMAARPILVMDGQRAVPTFDRTADEVYAHHVMTQDEIEHLLSMFFYDVRLKHYVEIRMVDSLPIRYALAYVALVKGVFYAPDALDEIARGLDGIGEHDVALAKRELERRGYAARVFGRRAWEWLDDLVRLSWTHLEPAERPYLEPLATLVERRTTLLDEAFEDEPAVAGARLGHELVTALPDTLDDASCTLSPAGLARRWTEASKACDEEVADRERAWRSMQESTAIYHDEVVDFGFVPALFDRSSLSALGTIAETTHRILRKVTRAYKADPSFRAAFGFDETLEKLVCRDDAYGQTLPICRIDVFCDLQGERDDQGLPPFSFCEFNTDGASAMNEDRAIASALLATSTADRLETDLELVGQSLFDPWVRRFMKLVAEALPDVVAPRVAIVDFTESSTPHEFREFQRRFAAHGVNCTICDIRTLSFDGSALRDPAGRVVDAVYRRAVTSEVMAHLDEVSDFVDAVAEGAVVCVGDFETQVGHSKMIDVVLRDERSRAILDDEEWRFVERHVPYTALLSKDCPVLDEVYARPRDWIVKPLDGYAAHGVFAGRDQDAASWRALVSDRLDGTHIVQRYCEQYALPNSRVAAPGKPAERLVPYDDLVGLFVYDGQFAGTYVRAGRQSIIAGIHGGMTLGSLLARPHRAWRRAR
ncbi:MAG: glutamate-cysteine ligase family protein [Coriobacteriales bacterium]